MTRVLFLSPAVTDADVRCHAEAIASIPNVVLTHWSGPAEDRLAYIFRVAGELFQSRRAVDVIITVGEAALASAAIAWRGPLIHLPVGRLTKVEKSLSRWLTKRGSFRIVTSSAAISQRATPCVIKADHVTIIRPALPTESIGRRAARERLGLADDQTLAYIPGIARKGSNHRLALWVANILYFRDPRTRVLVFGGGPGDGFVRRFVTSAEMWPAVVSDASLTEADAAAAADLAICATLGAPDFAPLAACKAAGTPIIGLQSTWNRDRFDELPAVLAAEAKPRLLARAALEALDAGRRSPGGISEHAARDWANVLGSLRSDSSRANFAAIRDVR